ncbi:MAG: hypothetical protein EXR98_19535 [Gemmataceae bacterium]|nr:hypothetical protein [Gemmataceae bacterium]
MPPRPKGNVEPAIPGDCEIYFLNGSKVRMIVQSETLDVATAYGKLSIPVKDIRAIEFGLHLAEGVEAKIEQAVKGLGSSDYRERDKSDKLLIELGPFSYPATLEASRGKEIEVANRAKEIVKKLQAKHPKKDLKTSVDDRIVTQHFTIVGRILTTTIKSKTEYFGDVELTLAKMRSLRAVGLASTETDVVIDSSKYANAGQWLDAGFMADGRSTIQITATGMIDVWPQQGGQMMSGPQGLQATQNGQRGIMGGARKIGANINNQVHCGMLLGKWGEDGEMFMIGERYDGTPDHEGKLFLHIGPSRWNAQCAGSFDVKITVKMD